MHHEWVSGRWKRMTFMCAGDREMGCTGWGPVLIKMTDKRLQRDPLKSVSFCIRQRFIWRHSFENCVSVFWSRVAIQGNLKGSNCSGLNPCIPDHTSYSDSDIGWKMKRVKGIGHSLHINFCYPNWKYGNKGHLYVFTFICRLFYWTTPKGKGVRGTSTRSLCPYKNRNHPHKKLSEVERAEIIEWVTTEWSLNWEGLLNFLLQIWLNFYVS